MLDVSFSREAKGIDSQILSTVLGFLCGFSKSSGSSGSKDRREPCSGWELDSGVRKQRGHGAWPIYMPPAGSVMMLDFFYVSVKYRATLLISVPNEVKLIRCIPRPAISVLSKRIHGVWFLCHFSSPLWCNCLELLSGNSQVSLQLNDWATLTLDIGPLYSSRIASSDRGIELWTPLFG